MDPAVADEFFQRDPRHFAADGVKARKNDDFGRIVDNEFDTRGVFQRADISSFPSDNPRFHIVVGKRYDGYGDLRSVVARALLNGEADDLFRICVRLVLGLLLDVAHLQSHVVTGLVHNVFGQKPLRLFLGQLGDFFQFLNHQIVLMVDLFLHLFDFAFLANEIFLLLIERVVLLLQGVLFFVEVVLFLDQSLFKF